MKIGELFVALGFKADTGKINQYTGAINGARKGLLAIYGAAGLASGAILKFTADAIDSAWQLSNFSNQTGLSYAQLQKWQIMANQAGVSSQNMTNSIQNLQRQLAEIRLGQGNVRPFQLLGVDVTQNAFNVMNQLRDRIKGLDRMTAVNLIQQMGFTPDMINILTMTNEELDKMRMEDTILSDKQINSLKSAGVAFQNMFRVMKYINSLVAVQLAPAIVRLSEKFREWAMNNKDKLIIGLEKVGKLLIRFIEAVFNAFVMIDNAIVATIGWKFALNGLLAVLAAISVALMASPLGLFIASIVALIAVLDDLYAWKKGKKSVFGEIFGEKGTTRSGGALGGLVSPLAGKTSGLLGAAKQLIQNITVQVTGVDKPQETADAVEKVFKNKLNMTSMQLNNSGI
jgi:hypothetical protein